MTIHQHSDSHIAKLFGPRFSPSCSRLPDLSHKEATGTQHVNQRWPELVLCYYGHIHHSPLQLHIHIPPCLDQCTFAKSDQHMLFYQSATLGSHPFCFGHKAISAASLPEVAHICLLPIEQTLITSTSWKKEINN